MQLASSEPSTAATRDPANPEQTRMTRVTRVTRVTQENTEHKVQHPNAQGADAEPGCGTMCYLGRILNRKRRDCSPWSNSPSSSSKPCPASGSMQQDTPFGAKICLTLQTSTASKPRDSSARIQPPLRPRRKAQCSHLGKGRFQVLGQAGVSKRLSPQRKRRGVLPLARVT